MSWDLKSVPVVQSATTPMQYVTGPSARHNGEPGPVVLRLNAIVPADVQAGVYGLNNSVAFFAGGQDNASEDYDEIDPNIGALVEWGYGAAKHRVLIDWQPGQYQLPACEWASVAPIVYGAAISEEVAPLLTASLAPGKASSPRIPTRSQYHGLDASETKVLQFTVFTRALELFPPSGDTAQLEGDFFFILRDLSTLTAPVYAPSVSPVPISPESYPERTSATLRNNDAGAATTVIVVEYLDLGG